MQKQKKQKPELDTLCKYCELALSLHNPDEMLCQKRGVVNAGYHCRAFRYDPLKRDPGPAVKPEALLPPDSEADL